MIHSRNLIGLLGGTFDPIHYGHLQLARALYTHLPFKEIRLLPCAQPLLRQLPMASATERFSMVQQVANLETWLTADDLEIKRGGQSYTLDTVTWFRKKMPHLPLCFILSIDQLLNFSNWYRWKDIITVVHLIVANRPPYTLDALNPYLKTVLTQHRIMNPTLLQTQIAGLIYLQTIPALAISASLIRKKLQRKETVIELVPPTVLTYIQQKNLYT